MTAIARAVVTAPDEAGVLSPEALDLVVALQREFAGRREDLLLARAERQERITAGELPDFLESTRSVREGDWRVAPVPDDLQDRRVEITGPAGDRKMVINAFNSGARIYMADFEDANSPTWENVVGGQQNLTDAIDRTISLEQGEKRYALNDEVAVLLVRPRGWHLQERHVEVDGKHVSAGLFDFGVYLHRNWERLLESGSGPYFYLPKLESHLEARLWNDVFCFAQDQLGIPRGTIKATVLIETILAAFEMEEILYELREHSAGPQRRTVGLHLLRDQEVPRPAGVRASGPCAGNDDRPVHARVHGVARAYVPRARRACNRRDGRVHPEPARPRGQRGGAREGERGQAA